MYINGIVIIKVSVINDLNLKIKKELLKDKVDVVDLSF
jgi:hypothetical protein